MVLFPVGRVSEGFKQGADMISCQSEDDSSKNVENGVRWIAPNAGRIGQNKVTKVIKKCQLH